MTMVELDHILDRLRNALEDDRLEFAIKILEELRSPDQAELIAELDEEDQVALLTHLDPSDTADILEELEDEDAADLVAALPPERAAAILDEMEPDEAADLLNEIPDEQMEKIISQLEDPEEIHPLLLHRSDSAGGLMTSQFLALRRRMTVQEAIQAIRQLEPDAETIHDFFVVDRHGVLCGVLDLRQLVINDPNRPIGEIMNREVLSVQAGTDQEEVARLMARYDLNTMPVLDAQGQVLGVITIDDVVDVLEDEATEDIQRMGGAQPLDDSYLSSGVLTVTGKRIGWLMLLFVTGSLTGTVMRLFEKDLQAVVALAYFIPLLIGTGGNAGSQTTATIIRALAVGDIGLRDGMHALWHEFRVGLLLGLGMGAFGIVRAITWGSGWGVALTVSLAILAIVVWANAMGSLLPLLAARLKIDPTVVSGPVMSTLVDATGLLIYFSIARLVLGL